MLPLRCGVCLPCGSGWPRDCLDLAALRCQVGGRSMSLPCCEEAQPPGPHRRPRSTGTGVGSPGLCALPARALVCDRSRLHVMASPWLSDPSWSLRRWSRDKCPCWAHRDSCPQIHERGGSVLGPQVQAGLLHCCGGWNRNGAPQGEGRARRGVGAAQDSGWGAEWEPQWVIKVLSRSFIQHVLSVWPGAFCLLGKPALKETGSPPTEPRCARVLPGAP